MNHELIPKLNARISNLKYREQKLLEENAKLEEMYNSLKKYLLFSPLNGNIGINLN